MKEKGSEIWTCKEKEDEIILALQQAFYVIVEFHSVHNQSSLSEEPPTALRK